MWAPASEVALEREWAGGLDQVVATVRAGAWESGSEATLAPVSVVELAQVLEAMMALEWDAA